eukprot:scaffold363_cov255-Pinguiococcus_pyrenoidosus.AAC.4
MLGAQHETISLASLWLATQCRLVYRPNQSGQELDVLPTAQLPAEPQALLRGALGGLVPPQAEQHHCETLESADESIAISRCPSQIRTLGVVAHRRAAIILLRAHLTEQEESLLLLRCFLCQPCDPQTCFKMLTSTQVVSQLIVGAAHRHSDLDLGGLVRAQIHQAQALREG